MLNRAIFLVVATFFVTMNVLLWRSEFSDQKYVGNSVPVGIVWKRILTAPDNSNLEILSAGKKIGLCRWSANIGEEVATGKYATENPVPDGMVKKLTGYSLDMDGNVSIGERTNRYRFYVGMKFTSTNTWEDFDMRIGQLPMLWEARASNPQETLTLSLTDSGTQWEHTYKFSELNNPDKLLQEAGGPMAPLLLGSLGGTFNDLKQRSGGLKWEAREDWVKFGQTTVRAFRVESRLMDRYKIVVIVSRVGEILRVDLPNGIVLLNEQMR